MEDQNMREATTKTVVRIMTEAISYEERNSKPKPKISPPT